MTGSELTMVFYAFVAGASIWPLKRLFTPWKCKCGHVHWSAHKMLEHVEMKHFHEVNRT